LPLRPGPFKFEPKDINRLITSLIPTGMVVAQEDFEQPAPIWKGTQTAGGGGAAGSAVRDTTPGYVLFGAASMLIKSGYDPSVVSVYEVDRHFCVPFGNGRLGFEFWFNASPTALNYLEFSADTDSVKHGYSVDPKIRYTKATGEFQYLDENGALQDLPNPPLDLDWSLGMFLHYMKIVIDYFKKKWVYVQIDDWVSDMSDIPLRTGPAYNKHNFEPYFRVAGDIGTAHAWFVVDNIVLTINE